MFIALERFGHAMSRVAKSNRNVYPVTEAVMGWFVWVQILTDDLLLLLFLWRAAPKTMLFSFEQNIETSEECICHLSESGANR